MTSFFNRYKKWILLSILAHVVASFTSVGFLHPDEHFQILEFLGLKLGTTPVQDLPWEFGAKMRPWLHSSIYYLITKTFELLGVEDRFILTYIFRLLSIALGLFSSIQLAHFCESKFKNPRYAVYTSLLLWPLPFIHARLSSEAIGTSLFTLALIEFFKKNKRSNLYTGVLFGISFLFRYHIGFMIFGLCLWSLIFKKKKISELTVITIMTFVIIGLSIPIDYWGYGEFTFAPYQYFLQNIIENKAANYGVSPWWYYFKASFNKLIAPIGILTIIGFLTYWVKKPLSWFTFTTLPFFFIHTLIGHKEWRFLFPLIPFIPIIVGFYFEKNNIKTWIPKVLIFINSIAMLISLKAAHPSYNFFKGVQKYNQIEVLYHNSSETPFNMYKLRPHFYNNINPKMIKIKDEEIEQYAMSGGWFFAERGRFSLRFEALSNCENKYYGSLSILKHLPIKYYNKLKIYTLWNCKNAKQI